MVHIILFWGFPFFNLDMNQFPARINGELWLPRKESPPNRNKQDNKDPSEFPEMTNSTRLSAVNSAFGIKRLVIHRAQLKWVLTDGADELCSRRAVSSARVSQDFWPERLPRQTDRQTTSQLPGHREPRAADPCGHVLILYATSVQLINASVSNNLIPAATNQSARINVASMSHCQTVTEEKR